MTDLDGWERVLAGVLRSPDPRSALEERLGDPTLAEGLRAALAAIDPDGLYVAARLVLRLRFERLLNGHAGAGQWFQRDPARFAAAFAGYHAEVPMSAWMPAEEAALWEAWGEGRG